MSDGSKKLLTKGEDSIIAPRLVKDCENLELTEKYLEEFASKGLRTLLLGEKVIDEDFYQDWNKRYLAA